MNQQRWVAMAAALGMMAASGWWLNRLEGMQILGPAGVKVGAARIFDERTNLAATIGVLLPTNIPGYQCAPGPITQEELRTLPQDTTFGREMYANESNQFRAEATAVLMGTDHTSIHQPQYCLVAQGWNITNSERITVRMDRPFAYDIPALKLTATSLRAGRDGQMHPVNGVYIYWFVSGDRLTSEEGSRLWSIAEGVLAKGRIERWAYISYFAACAPGRESDTYVELQKLMGATVPEFQIVTGSPVERAGAAARN